MPKILIFAVNDCEWWAAASAEDAIGAALSSWGYTREAATAEGLIDDPCEPLGDDDLERLIFNDDSEMPEGEMVKRTFREQLAILVAGGQKFPCMFASTEF